MSQSSALHAARAQDVRQFRTFDIVMAAFVAILLLSNVIGAAKVATVGGWEFGAGILFFPLGYVIGDVLTEVYGYSRARRCIWVGFAALLFMAFMSWVVVMLPPAPGWTGQEAYESVFGQVPRIVLASIVAFWAGELVNSFVLARMKDLCRTGCRQPDFLSAGLLRGVGNQPGSDRHGHQLGAESALGSAPDARHVHRRQRTEATRGRRCL
jgi:Putative vitamin uptake transporter